jgi:tetratricopeptide (TPR) repeat protein
LALGVILAGVAAWSPLRGAFRRSRVDVPYSQEHRRLLESLGTSRPLAARLSGGFSYSPYQKASGRPPAGLALASLAGTRGGVLRQDQGATGNQAVQATYLPIRRAVERNPSPENRAALAVFDIVQGRPQKAVPLLRKAHADRPSDPRFLNDLAVASLAVYESNGDPWAALEAIDTAAQADHLEPSPPARFNLALALERLDIRVRAIAAWERYLDLDSNSSWAQEAEQHLDVLKSAVAKAQATPQLLTTPDTRITDFPDNPWARRQLGERVLLTRWAERTLAHQPAEAEAALEQAEKLVANLSPDGGRLLLASRGVIREAEQSSDRARLDLLARGHQAFCQAFLRWREERATEARSLIDIAIRDLHDANTPFELRARVLQAWMVEDPDWNELSRISDEAEAGGFAAIIAEERRIAAYRITLEGRKEAATDVYQDSQQRFAALGEQEAVNVLSVMRTESLTELGRDLEASAELAAALKGGHSVADPWDRYSIYVVAAVAASNRFSRAAVELRLEAADACNSLHERALCSVDSWLRVASLTPDGDVAKDALERAEDLLPKTPDSDGKARTEIDLTMARARWLGGEDHSESDREDAAALYAEAANRYEVRGLAVSSANARSKRAKLLKSLGQTKEAAADYRSALKTFRLWDQSDRFRPERAEKRSPEVLRDTYESLIGIELDLADSRPSSAAFLLSEEMRDRLAPRRSPDIHLPTLKDLSRFALAVPRGTAVVEYAILGDRAAAWILAGGPLDQVILKVPNKLGERIGSLAAERNLERWKDETGALFQEFLTPVLRRLPEGTDRLVIVPDSQLYGIPFRALWNSGAGRYLDEDFTIALAPSVGQVLTASWNPPEGKLDVLSVGFSKYHPYLHLHDLPRANDEANEVLGIYGLRSNSCVVTNWEAFRLCAPKADIIHLATHATANSEMAQSWLAFPGETVNIERLWRELPTLPRHPLVVLSACESAATAKVGEGLGGLARPFLANGARAVVGNLWEVDDIEAGRIFLAFHRDYGKYRESTLSLQSARKRVSRWELAPWDWADVEVLLGRL